MTAFKQPIYCVQLIQCAADDPVRHVRTADLMTQALEHFLKTIQWQSIGVFGGNNVR